MLLSKTLIITLNSRTIKWYEEKGYDIHKYIYKKGRLSIKRGTTIEVRVEDLMDNSIEYVSVKCDCPDCKNPYLKPTKWQNYLKYVHEDGKYYCKKCAIKLFGSENMKKTKLKKSKSFEQWCYDNLDIDYANEILSRWDYELNGCLPSEVNFKSVGLNKNTHGYWFKCLKHPDHKSELKSISSFTSAYRKYKNSNILKCNQCNSFGQYLLDTYGENALELYWSNKNTENPFEIAKMRNLPQVRINCQNSSYHEDYLILCSNFVNGNRCPYCNKNSGKVHPKDSLGQYIINKFGKEFLDKVWSYKNDKSAFEYAPKTHKEVWWKCPDGRHEDYKRNIKDSNDADFRCSDCSNEKTESILQEKVRLYLEYLDYYTLHENKCTIVPKNPKTKQNMPFDNDVVDLKLIIEVHGIQHYEIISFHKYHAKRDGTTPEYELHKRKLYDRYKKIYAKMKNYNFLEIPYWTDDEDESWKELINNKIKEITNKSLNC